MLARWADPAFGIKLRRLGWQTRAGREGEGVMSWLEGDVDREASEAFGHIFAALKHLLFCLCVLW